MTRLGRTQAEEQSFHSQPTATNGFVVIRIRLKSNGFIHWSSDIIYNHGNIKPTVIGALKNNNHGPAIYCFCAIVAPTLSNVEQLNKVSSSLANASDLFLPPDFKLKTID